MQAAQQLNDGIPDWMVDDMTAWLIAASAEEQRKAKRRAKRKAASGGEYHPPQDGLSGREQHGSAGIEGGEEDEPQSCGAVGDKAPTYTPRALATRVDWLTVAFKVGYRETLIGPMARALEAAPDAMRIPYRFAGQTWELRERRVGGYLLRCADGVIVIDENGPEGWNVEVQLSGAIMMAVSLGEAVDRARRWAAACGAICGERVRRIDLCADVLGFNVADIDSWRWRKPSRARVARASVEQIAGDRVVRYQRGKSVTGYVVCPGNDITCVVYDKREELNIRAEKRDAEEDIWRARGWDGAAPVARVEFRLRWTGLQQFEVFRANEGLNDLEARIDGLWSYLSREWLRLRAPGMTGKDVVNEWLAVQLARFHHAASPATRKRLRAGASAAQAFGAALSCASAAQAMPKLEGMGAFVEVVDVETGEVSEVWKDPEPETDDEAKALVMRGVSAAMTASIPLVVEDLLQRFGPRDAATWVAQRIGATAARFASAA